MEEIVISVSGKSCKKSECRYIDKKYYFIGNVKEENSGDVFLINDRYIRLETGRIVFNHTKKEYTSKASNIIHGAIGFNEEYPIYGYFEINPITTVEVVLKDGTNLYCISENVINRHYREKRSTGKFYHISQVHSRVFNAFQKISRGYKESLSYDSKNVMNDYTKLLY